MIRFINGPAQGQALMVRRCPVYLRAVQGADGKWDALDQPEDTPHATETAYAYIRQGEAGACHISVRGKDGKRGGGFYQTGTYEVCFPQPDAETMADNNKWQAWCMEDDQFCCNLSNHAPRPATPSPAGGVSVFQPKYQA